MGIIAAGAPSCVTEPERVVVEPFRLLGLGVHLRNGFSVGHHAPAVFELVLGPFVVEPLESRYGPVVDAGTDEGCRDRAAATRLEVAYPQSGLLVDSERYHCTNRRLVPVVARVEPPRDPAEGLQTTFVWRSWARDAQVNWIALGWAGAVRALVMHSVTGVLSTLPHACFAEGQNAATVPMTLQISFIFSCFASQICHS